MNDVTQTSQSNSAGPDEPGAILAGFLDQVYSLAYYLLGDAPAAERCTRSAFSAALRDPRALRDGGARLCLLRQLLRACDGVKAAPVRGLPTGEKLPAALLSLPFDLRAAAVLVDVAGLDYGEAAQAAGASVATLAKRLALARVRLSQALRSRGSSG